MPVSIDEGNSGFNRVFVASGDRESDIGVDEIGLPPPYPDYLSRYETSCSLIL